MVSKIHVSPELLRLTQQRANRFDLPYRSQVARCVAEQAVLELDPEFNFLVDGEASLAEVDALVHALKVNDIVVNGRHIDVAVLEGGDVFLSAALIDTPYLECGSLVVEIDGANSGTVVGYVDAKDWHAQASTAQASTNSGADVVALPFKTRPGFDLAVCLQALERSVKPNVDKPLSELPKAEDYLQFSRDRQNMSLIKQRGVVAAAVSSAAVRKNIGHLGSSGGGASKDRTVRLLRDSAVWEIRTLEAVEKIQSKFPTIPAEKIEEAIRQVGAQYGGQPQAPVFKETLLKLLAKQQLYSRFSPEVRAMMSAIIDKVAAGKSKTEAIQAFVKNQAAVEVARIIEERRDALRQFATASADEIGAAFQQLALQPAYATHSASDSTGVDSINDALHLFEAASLYEELMGVDI